MKQVIYKGPETNLGTHGQVKPGQVLALGYDEWLSVRGNPLFEPKHGPKTAKEEMILPAGAKSYDLTTLPWGEAGIVNKLRKLKKSTVIQIAGAMRELGLEVPDSVHDSADAVVDSILFAADYAGWMD